MDRFVSAAIGMGKRAALAIDRALRGEPADAAAEPAAVPLAAIATWYHEHAARVPSPKRLPSERHGGLEVQLGLALEAALAEAERCFSCGLCIACDNCVSVCPDLAVRHLEGTRYEVLADYCKGCGLCVRECPTGSMAMQEEQR
jgi:Pyruvate/2-oxoacid:ferredoxin oxidoreductase delta subunit